METKKIQTLKKDLTEDDKNLSVGNLELPSRIVKMLNQKKIYTLGELLNIDIATLLDMFAYDRHIVDNIAYAVHNKGACLKNEYAGLGISDEVALIPIQALGLSTRIKRSLKWAGVYVMGDLLSRSAEDLLKMRNFGKNCLQEMRDYLRLFGYGLKNEAVTVDETRKKLREEGANLLEDILSSGVYLLLYKNGIYTTEDLQAYGPEVFYLPCMGEKKIKELKGVMGAYHIKFQSAELPAGPGATKEEITPTEETIRAIKSKNDALRARVARKATLIADYNALIEEQKQLQKRDQELNALIAAKLEEMNHTMEGMQHGGK